jgi:hypothetical protein
MISSASEWPDTNGSDMDGAPRQNHVVNTCYSLKSSVTSPDRTDNKLEEDGENITLMTAWESYKAVFRIHRIHMFLGLLDPDPDPLVRGMDPDPDLDEKIVRKTFIPTVL